MRPAPRRPGNNSTWSVMRAPAESTSQKIGTSWRSAYSVRRTIFSTVRAPHDPAFTVGSLAITQTGRPSTRPTPVTTPSAGKSPAMALASRASSTHEPSSSRRVSRSRTKSLFWLASFSRWRSRLPWRARSRAPETSIGSRALRPADGQDGDVVAQRPAGELARRLQQRLGEDVGLDAGIAPHGAGDALFSEQLLTRAGLGQPVRVHQDQVARGEVDLPAHVVGPRIEREKGSGGSQRADLAVVPQPGRRVTGRGVAQAVGHAVEDHDADGDELLGPALGGQGGVELLEGLGRVPELPEEDAQQVLHLEGGDRRLDAVAGYVADDGRQPAGADGEEVVEVAGHEAGARLVDVAHLVALEDRQLFGGQAGGPPAGRQLGLGEDLLGSSLELGALLGQAGLVLEPMAVDQGEDHGDEDQVGRDVEQEVLRHRRHREGNGGHRVQEGGVQFLAVRGPGQV